MPLESGLPQVVIGCGPMAVKIYMRLWLQKFVSPVSPQPLVRVQGMVYIVLCMSKGAGHGLYCVVRV